MGLLLTSIFKRYAIDLVSGLPKVERRKTPVPFRAVELSDQEFDDLAWAFEAGRAKAVQLARHCSADTAQKHAARARRLTSLAQKFQYHQRDVDAGKQSET